MKEQLIQYVNLLFAGSTGTEDIKQEILQNTLDRYDDLLAQGLSPEAAYRQAIEGVGDVGAIIDAQTSQTTPEYISQPDQERTERNFRKESTARVIPVPSKIKVPSIGRSTPMPNVFQPEEVESLDINWVAGSVSISAAQQATITVAEEPEDTDHPMLVQLIAGKLTVKFCGKKTLRNMNMGQKDLCVTVPASWSGRELKISTVSADVACSGLTFAEAKFNAASGDSKWEGCRIEALHVESASGDVRYDGNLKALTVDSASGDLEYTGSLETLNLNSASGDADIVLQGKPQKLSFSVVSGDLNLTLPGDCGFTLKRSSLSGDFWTDFDVVRDGKYRIYGDGACPISVSGVSGDIFIHRG